MQGQAERSAEPFRDAAPLAAWGLQPETEEALLQMRPASPTGEQNLDRHRVLPRDQVTALDRSVPTLR